jgi:hypothetical protein
MESRPLESRFTELASTDLSDQAFFEEVFLDYLHSVYPRKENAIQDLARLRHLLNQNDEHTQRHLRDKLDSILYQYHKRQQEIAIAEKIILKQKIEQMEKQIEGLIQKLEALMPDYNRQR